MESDTIVAIVTPPGEGGVGIVRASGPLGASLPARLFPAQRGPWPSHRMRHGEVVDPTSGRPIDRALGCLMRAPRSYTGEDAFEIHCHGNPLILEGVMAACLALGCRPARPGEFTLRAFLNGRLDLTQAEAVLDVVRARTNAGLDMALQALAGWLGDRVEPIREDLLGILAHMEALVDFVEEDVPPRIAAEERRGLEAHRYAIAGLLAGTEAGAVLREGASLCLVGSPNVGKSSIMNGLLGMERSIVTPIPGTTRDTVEETVDLGGVPFRVIDTAGINDTADLVEGIGVERSRRSLATADVALLVLDRSRPLGPDDRLVLEEVTAARRERPGQGLVITLNKTDLPPVLDPNDLPPLDPYTVVSSSALHPGGLGELRDALARTALGARHEVVPGNVRHADVLRRARDALDAALCGLDLGTPLDLVSFDVRAAVTALSEITGHDVDDELLDRIFRDFCIGK